MDSSFPRFTPARECRNDGWVCVGRWVGARGSLGLCVCGRAELVCVGYLGSFRVRFLVTLAFAGGIRGEVGLRNGEREGKVVGSHSLYIQGAIHWRS